MRLRTRKSAISAGHLSVKLLAIYAIHCDSRSHNLLHSGKELGIINRHQSLTVLPPGYWTAGQNHSTPLRKEPMIGRHRTLRRRHDPSSRRREFTYPFPSACRRSEERSALGGDT